MEHFPVEVAGVEQFYVGVETYPVDIVGVQQFYVQVVGVDQCPVAVNARATSIYGSFYLQPVL